MSEYTKIKYRYFLLSFSIAFFILTLMLLLMVSAVQPKMPESLLREPEDDVSPVYAPTSQDSITVLFVGVESEASATGTFLLARFDPVRGKVPIIVFPAQTAIKNADKTETIAEVYRYGGVGYTKNALAETLGIPIDRYVKMRLDSFIAAAAVIGTVEYDLADTITVDHGGASVTLNQGKQLLDGQKAADVIGYGYSGDELYRCKVTAGLAAAIVNQRKDICLTTVVDNVFEKIINLINTDISYTDYYNRKNAAKFLAQMCPEPAEPIEVAGHWDEDGKIFTMSDTFMASLTQVMR